MNCRQFRERIQLYLAEALPGKWSEQMKVHGADCDECREALAQARHILDRLHSLETPTPPQQLASRIKAAVRAVARSKSEPARRWRWSIPTQYQSKLALAAVAACAVVVTMVVTSPYNPYRLTPRLISSPQPEVIAKAPSEPEVSAPALSPAPASIAPASRLGQIGPTRRAAASAEPTGGRPGVAQKPVARSQGETETESSDQPPPAPKPVVVLAPTGGIDSKVQVAALPQVQIPVSVTQAALHTDLARESPTAEAPTDLLAAEDNDLTGALVSGVVANILVDKYVQEAVIGADETLLRVVTSTPVAPPALSAADSSEESKAE